MTKSIRQENIYDKYKTAARKDDSVDVVTEVVDDPLKPKVHAKIPIQSVKKRKRGDPVRKAHYKILSRRDRRGRLALHPEHLEGLDCNFTNMLIDLYLLMTDIELLRRQNGIERFNAENQGAYELHKRRSGDRVETVRRHNRAYPRLNDELDKRNSVTRVTTIKARELDNGFDWKCRACAKIATLNYLKRRNPKPKCGDNPRSGSCFAGVAEILESRDGSWESEDHQSYKRKSQNKKNKNKKSHEKLVGVNKSKQKSNQNSSISCFKLTKIWVQKSCQCSICNIAIKESKFTCVTPKTRSVVQITSQEKNLKTTGTSASNMVINVIIDAPIKEEKAEECQLRTRDPSVSSYHSYESIEHEPMDCL